MFIEIILFDGSVCRYDNLIIGFDVVGDIGFGLVKVSFVMYFNDQLVDLFIILIEFSCIVFLICDKDVVLELLCYDVVYVMVQVVKELYLEIQVIIGFVIENGFYYDFYCEEFFILEDLYKIEFWMVELVEQNIFI